MITQKVLYLSMLHLNKKDIEWMLSSEDNYYAVVYNISKNDESTDDLMVYITDTDIASESDIPDNVKHCFLLANQLDCNVIRFNRDFLPIEFLTPQTVKKKSPTQYTNLLDIKTMVTFAINDMSDEDIDFMDELHNANDSVYLKEHYGWYVMCGKDPKSFVGKLVKALVANYTLHPVDILCIDNEY